MLYSLALPGHQVPPDSLVNKEPCKDETYTLAWLLRHLGELWAPAPLALAPSLSLLDLIILKSSHGCQPPTNACQ